MSTFLKKLFKRNQEPEPSVPEPNYTAIINQIKKRETTHDIAPGKKIHEFDYALYTLRLDRDITKNYRITVFRGNERIYSFTVFTTKGEIDKLDGAYRKVIGFLNSEQLLKNLPDSDLLKGFYFGNGS